MKSAPLVREVTKDAEPEKNNTDRPTRRLLTRFAIGALVLSLILAITGWAVFRFTNATDMLMRSTVKNLALSQRNDLFTDGQIHVIILGTGSPVPPQNPVDRTIADVSTLEIRLAYPDTSPAVRPARDRQIEPEAAMRARAREITLLGCARR